MTEGKKSEERRRDGERKEISEVGRGVGWREDEWSKVERSGVEEWRRGEEWSGVERTGE